MKQHIFLDRIYRYEEIEGVVEKNIVAAVDIEVNRGKIPQDGHEQHDGFFRVTVEWIPENEKK